LLVKLLKLLLEHKNHLKLVIKSTAQNETQPVTPPLNTNRLRYNAEQKLIERDRDSQTERERGRSDKSYHVRGSLNGIVNLHAYRLAYRVETMKLY